MVFSRFLAALAVAPGLFLAIKIYKLDKIEKEPIGLLIKLFLLGAATIISALILETVGDFVLQLFVDTDSLLYGILENMIVVACVEEAGKYVVLRKATWKNPEFNYRFDAIIYSVIVSLGFAVLENVSYAFSYGLATTLIRAVTAVPAHTIFGIFMGHYYGEAKFFSNAGNLAKAKRKMRLAYLVPVFLHGVYDILAGDSSLFGWFLFIGFVITFDIIAYFNIKRDSKQDSPV